MDAATRIAVIGIGSPLVMGTLAGVATGVLKRERSGMDAGEHATARVLAVFGVTLAMFVGLFGVYGKPDWPPAQMSDRLFLAPAAIGLVGLAGVLLTVWLERHRGGHAAGSAWLVSAAAAGVGGAIGCVIALGPALWNGSLAGAAGVAWVPIAFGAWSAAAGWAVAALARRRPERPDGAGDAHGWPRTGALLLIGLSAAVGAGLLGTGGRDLGLLAFSTSAACLGLLMGVLFVRGHIGAGASAVACAMLGALLSCGVLLSATPWWVAGALGCVAPASALMDRLVGGRLGPIGGSLARLAPGAIIGAAAVAPGVASLVRFLRGE